ncbi:rhodanese-like domain-containing protein [Altibacter sp. HG106]|uniref:rhodanese-like domain-containing protein n=1 Tax=Altibacter sp. HG106 TaxID=3023937 RepID=UPI002350A199|nr:rhodanese-like domain-containing protein [Altibacter sp. HG106]MDC7995814.1 rhodanese-like domain-containing protein [Altibacter sp. HG106]
MKSLFFTCLVAITVITACAQETKNTTILSKSEFQTEISDKDVTLIDVRTAEEFEAGHIDGAQNIDFFQEQAFQKKFSAFDKDQPIYIYCRSGNRSGQASERLEAMGFTKIYDLKGGYLGWVAN